MARDSIVFALANPTPEIMPEEVERHVRIVATGRSDYPNQINNVLCFPGIFRGALNCRASQINEAMKLAAAEAIAGILRRLKDGAKMEEVPQTARERMLKEIHRKAAAKVPDEL